MTRKKSNPPDVWRKWCEENTDLLGDLPGSATKSEKDFRTLVTDGEVEDTTLRNMRVQDLANIWKFVQHRTEFDMDASGFDALNAEVKSRVPEEMLGPPPPKKRKR